MNRLSLYNIVSIIKFELKTQLRTKSFWVLSLVPPIALVLLYVVNSGISHKENVVILNETSLQIDSIDDTTLVADMITSDNKPLSYLEKNPKYDAFVHIFNNGGGQTECVVYPRKMIRPENINRIVASIRERLLQQQLGKTYLDAENFIKSNLEVKQVLTQKSKKSIIESGLTTVAIIAIYLTIFQFAGSIQRAITREKKSKIAEILLSAMPGRDIVRGKLISGLILTLIQILFWCILGIATLICLSYFRLIPMNSDFLKSIVDNLKIFGKSEVIIFIMMFVFSLISGHLLYSILFTIIGASANDNTNTSQFTLLVTIPLLLSFMYVTQSPDINDPLFILLTILPFSSPITLISAMVKGVSLVYILLGIGVMCLSLVLLLRYVSLIYEKGILTISSKISLQTMLQWIKKKD